MHQYAWSSYKGYLSWAKKWDWLYKDYIFSIVSSKKQGRLKAFIALMNEDDSPEMSSLFSKKNLPPIFGPESFLAQIKESFYLKKRSYEIPESKHLAPAIDLVIEAVCKYYQVTFDDLLVTRRGVFNKPRNVAIYLLRQIRGDELNDIKKLFQIKSYSAVSSIVQKMILLNKTDKMHKRELQELKKEIGKGQM